MAISTPRSPGWAKLHAQLPKEALRQLPEMVYGVRGLTDVNEGYLIERLHQSGLQWSERLLGSKYLGSEVRTTRTGKQITYYLAQVDLELEIDGQTFVGCGAHDNARLDAAFKGAKTAAFKAAVKSAGMTIELFKDGRAMDIIYDDAEPAAGQGQQAPPPVQNGAAPSNGAGDKTKILMTLAGDLPDQERAEAGMAWVIEATRKGETSPQKMLDTLVAAHSKACGGSCVHSTAAIATWPYDG